jgi:prepilin-type N-terminal cleavage/methylation domain-containing protein
MKLITYNSRRSMAGFSLVEILVVLVIASILAAVTLGGYSAMRASNSRTSCQANMAQIYQAIRLYATDYDGNVPYYDPNNTLGNGKGLGLWALYTFASDSNSTLPADADIKPEKRYLTNAKLFHCPSDIADIDEQLYTPVPPASSTNSEYNPNYLSYQVIDYGCQDPKDSSCSGNDLYPDNPYTTPTDHYRYTYNPIQTTDITKKDPNGNLAWQRQLLTFDGSTFINRPPTDDTVILWCPFHRGHGSASTDNVLFWDGTVQSLPENEGTDSSPIIGADRTPKNP